MKKAITLILLIISLASSSLFSHEISTNSMSSIYTSSTDYIHHATLHDHVPEPSSGNLPGNNS